jgi:hypothetical protein
MIQEPDSFPLALAGIRVLDAAVDVQHVARAPGRTRLRGEVQHGVGYVLGQHVELEDVALAVVLFQFVRLYAVALPPLPSDEGGGFQVVPSPYRNGAVPVQVP